MLTTSDLIRLPYPSDLTEAGIHAACQWLAGLSHPLGEKPFNHLRQRIGQVSVELALRRLLRERQIAFQTLDLEPFTDPLNHDLALGGHRLHVVTTLLTRRQQISSLKANPGELLQASALVPLDEFIRDGQTENDIYMFAFLLALTATSRDDQVKIELRHQPHYYFANLPRTWSCPETWIPLKPLTAKSGAEHPVILEFGGRNSERDFITERIQLLPSTRTELKEDFFSLAYIHSLDRPSSSIGIHSPRFSHAHILTPTNWGNIWLYGLETWFIGWLTHDEFRRKSFLLPAGQPTFQYSHTEKKNLCVPIKELRPLNELFRHLQSASLKT